MIVLLLICGSKEYIISKPYAYDLEAKKQINAKKCYVPARGLVSTIRDLLLFEQEKKSRENKINAGEKLTRIEKKQEEEEPAKVRLLEKRKVDILNQHVFPSMANLVVFLEYAANPELREIFEKDIQALFFGVSKKTIDDKIDAKKTDKDKAAADTDNANELYRFINDRNVFYRFISAILALSKETELTDFRFILSDILQKEILDMIGSISLRKFNDDSLFHNVIMPDMARAAAWSSSLSRDARAHSVKMKLSNSRPVLF
jgi:hypothetical protein